MPIKKLKLSQIVIDSGTDVRSELSEETISEYGDSYKAKQKLPPLRVFDCGDEGMILADGYHRYFGCERQGIKEVECEITKGTRSQALIYALGANTTHGLRRSNADKRNAVEIALKEFPNKSDRQLADICLVSHTFIATVRPAPGGNVATSKSKKPNEPEESEPEIPPRREGKDGKNYPVPPPRKNTPPPRPEPEPVTKDGTEIEVPQEIVPFWDATFAKGQRLLTMISEIRSELKLADGKHVNSLHFAEVDKQDCIAKCDQLYVDIKRSIPFAVCPECNGVMTDNAPIASGKLSDKLPTDKCALCKGRGFVSKFMWDNVVTDDVKKVTHRG